MSTTAGSTHALNLRTKYYNATIPIWIDEPSDTDTWREDFISPDAGEVVRALGAWVVVFREEQARREFGAVADGDPNLSSAPPATEEKAVSAVKGRDGAARLMRGVRDAIEAAHGGPGVWDGVCLAIGMPASKSIANRSQHAGRSIEQERSQDEEKADEAWEDLCYDLGFEYIDCSSTHGSGSSSDEIVNGRDKVGLQRVLEALETCDWDNIANGEVDNDGIENAEDETLGFGLERAQLEAEFAGLKTAMSAEQDEEGDDIKAVDGEAEEEAIKVEELERMMHKMHAVRGESAIDDGQSSGPGVLLSLADTVVIDMSADMPEQERRRLAAKTVNEIMKTI